MTATEHSEHSDRLMMDAARDARRMFVQVAATHVVSCGRVLWAFGLVEEPSRRALSMALQAAGSLAEGARLLLDAGNRYGASALLRQLIEVDYLLWLFGREPALALAWLTATTEKERAPFRPSQLRARAGGWFLADEYWTHCEVGGHPHPRGHHLLPDHLIGRPEAEAHVHEVLWLDLAIHVDRLWQEFDHTRQALGLTHVVAAREASAAMREAAATWLAADPLGRDVVEGLARTRAMRVAAAAA